jgi:RimJ/RimL family protein N-acetyltransferase
MVAVHLVPMGESDYVPWRERAIREYAADNVRSGRWTQTEALARSAAQFDEMLADGPNTTGHYLWTVRDAAGGDVGILWVATDRRPGHVFIYDIEIDESRRGGGLGTATLAALEHWCRANGISSIGLHVFGHNEGAWRLYRRMGYVETNINMEKRL